MNRRVLALGLLLILSSQAVARAQESREFTDENGVRFRETKQVVRRAVTKMETTPEEKTVYRQEFNTEMKEAPRSYWQAVTQYQMTPVWERSWNPFNPPYVAYRMVPVTKWELKNDTVKYAYTTRKDVADKQTVQVQKPVTSYVDEVYTSKVVIGVEPTNSRPSESGGQTDIARRSSSSRASLAPQLESDADSDKVNWGRGR